MRGLRLAFGLVVVLLTASASEAQSLYVFGGAGLTWRKTGWQQQSADDLPPERKPVPTLAVGGGWWITPRLAIDGSVEFQRRQTLSWRYTYFDNNYFSSTDRDTLILGHVRIVAARGDRVALEALVGGGLTWHGTESFVLQDCNTNFPPTCVTPDPPTKADTYGTWEWVFSTGVDVPIRLSDHVTLAPTVRLRYADRRPYLTATDHRGPASGPGFMPSIGLTLRWTAR